MGLEQRFDAVLCRSQFAVAVSLGFGSATLGGEAQAQRCAPLPIPARLPSVRQLLDSSVALAILSGDTAFASGMEVLAIGIDAAGALRQVRVLQADLPPQPARRLATAIAGLIDPQPPGAPGQFRLALELGTTPRLTVSRSELCRPTIRPNQTTTSAERIGTGDGGSGAVAGATRNGAWQELGAEVAGTSNRWLVTVDAAGRVVDATPLAGIAPPIAIGARAAVLKLAFYPASLDGVPVTMRDTVTIGGP